MDINKYFNFDLSPFQQVAIQAIQDGKHCLVTAHTGSGKTVPAEFAIQYFTELGKKVIYTSPIKALSNQKLHDFRLKFPHISFGIVTGDIEDNKEAQVLIMTTEILANALVHRRRDSPQSEDLSPQNSIRFDMDYENDLAAVVFDEVHYISDPDRGVAWEQSMMSLPKHVLMIMLSATISNPNLLCNWIQDITGREVVLSPTTERVVPLTHYVYMPQYSDKVSKRFHPTLLTKVQQYEGRLTTIKRGEGSGFMMEQYSDVYNTLNRMTETTRVPNSLIDCITHLRKQNMLPALCFVFSRARTEELAHKVYNSCTVSLFGDEMKGVDIEGRIKKEARHLLSSKLPNFEDFMSNNDFQDLLKLLSRGIAYHHAGMLPIMRELVELLDGRGYVKLLFATETFAVGVNMPTKSVIFTSLEKRDNTGYRPLHPQEYTQMAGRAGRRGLDKVGHCVLLPEHLLGPNTMKSILSGSPPSIKSQYKVSYSLLINLLKDKSLSRGDLIEAARLHTLNSLTQPTQMSYANKLRDELRVLEQNVCAAEERLTHIRTPKEVLHQYFDAHKRLNSGLLRPKAVKQAKQEMLKLCSEHFHIERDLAITTNLTATKQAVLAKHEEIDLAEQYIVREISAVIDILLQTGLIEAYPICSDVLRLTKASHFASNIYESHPIGLSMFIKSAECEYFNSYQPIDIASMLAPLCDSGRKTNDDNDDMFLHLSKRRSSLNSNNETLEDCFNKAYSIEQEYLGGYLITQEYTVNKDFGPYATNWANASTREECMQVINSVQEELGMSIGDFVKTILKTLKLAKEIQSAASVTGDIILEQKCSQMPGLLLKHIVTNQSLYV